MDYHLKMKNLSSPKPTFHGKKLQYQENVAEATMNPHPPSKTTTTTSPTYLTAESAWKTLASHLSPSSKHTDGPNRQVDNTPRQEKSLFS